MDGKTELLHFLIYGKRKKDGGHKGRRVVLIFCLIRFELEHNIKGQLKCSYVRVASKRFKAQTFLFVFQT